MSVGIPRSLKCPPELTPDRCTGCNLCVNACPVGACVPSGKIVEILDNCVSCHSCIRSCNRLALAASSSPTPDVTTCTNCQIFCAIPQGCVGSCLRYVNQDGRITRNTPIHVFDPSRIHVDSLTGLPARPIITGIGAGTTNPSSAPAPFIVEASIDGIDMVTVVTEAPLSYSALRVKVDTEADIGKKGARVTRDGQTVGSVGEGSYMSTMLQIGGLELLNGVGRFTTARTIVELANGGTVRLKVHGGQELELTVGQPPIIGDQSFLRMKALCGSATVDALARELSQVVDEALFLDVELTGLLSEHQAGIFQRMLYSGVVPSAKRTVPGRYIPERGIGWGGTNIITGRQAIKAIDPNHARPGMRILVTETTGMRAAFFVLDEALEPVERPVPPEVEEVLSLVREATDGATVNALYVGGLAGARGSLTTHYRNYSRVNAAIRSGNVKLTVGGAEPFILPGGGITFEVDVSKIPLGAFYRNATPVPIVPLEFTMRRATFEQMAGHLGAIRSLESVLAGEHILLDGNGCSCHR